MLAKTACGALSAAIIAVATTALAHSTLETSQASPNSTYKGVLRVPHGCKGSDTTAVRVQIPDGVLDVKPMPKPGWRLEVRQGGYDHPQTLNGAKVDRGVREISWSGGDLPDAYYDEFIFRAYLSSSLKAGDTLYFPTIQECKQGMTRWIEKTDSDDESSDPAPHLKLTAPSSSGHHHK